MIFIYCKSIYNYTQYLDILSTSWFLETKTFYRNNAIHRRKSWNFNFLKCTYLSIMPKRKKKRKKKRDVVVMFYFAVFSLFFSSIGTCIRYYYFQQNLLIINRHVCTYIVIFMDKYWIKKKKIYVGFYIILYYVCFERIPLETFLPIILRFIIKVDSNQFYRKMFKFIRVGRVVVLMKQCYIHIKQHMRSFTV